MATKTEHPKKTQGFAEDASGFGASDQRNAAKSTVSAKVEVGRGGRIVIPAAMRAQMGIEEGSRLLLLLEGEELAVMTQQAGIRRSQAMVRKWSSGARNIVDELLQDRRREVDEEENS